MAPPRPYWKGYLKLSLVSCPIALYAATSSSERVSFRQINRKTGNRLRMRMVDEETGREVPRDEQVKGFQVSKRSTVPLDDEDLDKIALEATHVMEITKFVPREDLEYSGYRFIDRKGEVDE